MDVLELIRRGESETLEFKKSLSEIKEILRTICSFLNTKGGKILIGINDKGKILGVNIGKGTIENLANRILREIYPKVLPSIGILEIGGKKIIVISVGEGENKPYFYKGIAYKRVGKTDQIISPEEMRVMLRKMEYFEDRKVEFDVDEESLKLFVKLSRENRRLAFEYKDPEEVLRRIGIHDNMAGMLCFGKNPQRKLPYATIKIGIFKGDEIKKFWEVNGNLIKQLLKAMEILREVLCSRMGIKEWRREKVLEIPEEALREAVLNAIVHRDYSFPSFIYIRIYEDRLEIVNPGNLLPPLKPEDLKKDHVSVLRNPKIANVFFLMGFIEKWGRGTNKIVKECIKRGLKEPEFIEKEGFFKVVLYREISEREKEIIDILKIKSSTSKEIAKKLGISDRMVRNYLKYLEKKDIVGRKRIGRKIIYFLK